MLGGPPHLLLLVFLIHPCCYSLTMAQPPFWISEVYNSFYNFNDVFVEIYDGGHGNTPFVNISLELEKQNHETLNISLNNMTTNNEGFLVLSLDNADEPTKDFLQNIQNETVTLKLTIPGKANDSQIDVFHKEKGWSDIISCFRNESTVNAIVLVGNKPSEGKPNDCPSSPVRLDLLMCRSPFNLTLQLISHGIDQFPLTNHLIHFLEDNSLIKTISLSNHSTRNKKVNISLAISQPFKNMSTYIINLELQKASKKFILDSLYFGAQPDSEIHLNQTLKTYPATNPAQLVSPVYLQLVPSTTANFASCYCEVSNSTYNSFVNVNSSVFRTENCQKKCNELISTSAAVPTTSVPTTSVPTTSVPTTSVPMTSVLTTASISPNRTPLATVSLKDESTTNPSTSVVTNVNDTTNLKGSTRIDEDLTTLGSTSILPETTEKSTTMIPTTVETYSSTEFRKSTLVTNFSETTPQKLLTSTDTMTTQISILQLYINEVKVGLQSNLDRWIELKGNKPLETVSSYVLVHNVAGRTNNTTFSLNKLETTNKEGLLYINFNTTGARQLLKDLNSKAGLLRLFNSKVTTNKDEQAGLSDCVAYQMEGTLLETKLVNLCPLHEVKQITLRELSHNWTIGRCRNKFEVLEPSANQTNKCPSQTFSKHVYLKILKKQVSVNFSTSFISSLVQKLSADKGCMLSAAFFFDFSAINSGADINIHAFLIAPNQAKLNALFMCYKTLFHTKPVALKLGSETVSVYRCYNASYILPTIKVAEASSGRKTLAFVIPLLVLFVCLVGGIVIYMRYRRKSLLGVLGMARYDADQDDLLVNMDDVGRLDTNFQNPTYSQLAVY